MVGSLSKSITSGLATCTSPTIITSSCERDIVGDSMVIGSLSNLFSAVCDSTVIGSLSVLLSSVLDSVVTVVLPTEFSSTLSSV